MGKIVKIIGTFFFAGFCLAANVLASPDAEKNIEYRFQDGVRIRVYFTDQMIKDSGEDVYFPKEVLDAAVMAYQTITQFEGFNTPGYSFASPDKRYAYDPDGTIDIFLGNPDFENPFQSHGLSATAFKDAPCFETIQLSATAFQAVILLPANYKEFIKNWEKINPSSLGQRNVNVDLRGTLMHEMLHTILFYYNKNLNKENGEHDATVPTPGVTNAGAKDLDWYVEGLARYFETFAGARHDFYSQGFKQVLPDKIRFSRGGSNYFMRYPDQAFTHLRYENALFWRFIDYRFGMSAIEALSRDFRRPEEQFKTALERVTGEPLDELLKQFAVAALEKDFGLKEDENFLKDIARTRLVYRDKNFYLMDGFGQEQLLGKVCKTDWIGAWDDKQAHFGEFSVAGDGTPQSDVAPWATDFYEITLDGQRPDLPAFKVTYRGTERPLEVQCLVHSKGGSVFRRQITAVPQGSDGPGIDLSAEMKKEGLDASSVEKIYLLITNPDPQDTAEYEIALNP